MSVLRHQQLLGSTGGNRIVRDTNIKLPLSSSGIGNLPADLTINGTTVAPSFRYKGGDATATAWPAWGYGDDLAIAGAGTAPSLNQGSPGLGVSDDSVCYKDGKYHEASSSTFADITTEDIVLEVVISIPVSAGYMLGKRSVPGYRLYSGSNLVVLALQDAGGSVSIASAAQAQGSICHCICFVDRSGHAQWYINGVASGSALDVSGTNATLSNTDKITIGSWSGTSSWSSCVHYAAMWYRSAWLDSHLQPTIATERFAQLQGIYPQLSKGTATPVVNTRTTAGYLQKTESDGREKLYLVGANWLRVEPDGLLSEAEVENLIDESNDFEAWTKSDAGDVVDDDISTGPDGGTTAATWVADSTSGEHSLSYDATTTAAAHTFSVHVKAGTATWIKLANETGTNVHCWFNASTGAVGTAGAGGTGYASSEFVGDGYRFEVVGTATAAANTFRVYLCDSDGSDTYSGGDGAATDAVIYGAQVELGTRATSYYPTNAATGTRTKDQLYYKGDDGNVTAGQGTLAFDIPAYATAPVANKYLGSINDGGSSDEAIDLHLDTSGNVVAVITDSTVVQATLTSTTVVTDGSAHTARLTWTTNSIALYIDGASEATDTSCTIPTGLDRITLGADSTLSNQLCGHISNVRIYNKPTTRG